MTATSRACNSPTLRVLDIIPGTSVDGPGLRTSIYFAGCAHRCPGCHNPQSWDFTAGNEMSINEIVEEVDDTDSMSPFQEETRSISFRP